MYAQTLLEPATLNLFDLSFGWAFHRDGHFSFSGALQIHFDVLVVARNDRPHDGLIHPGKFVDLLGRRRR
jgi:hypothetical protein